MKPSSDLMAYHRGHEQLALDEGLQEHKRWGSW